MTLQQVADRAELAKSHVWEIENGRARNPTIETAVKLSAALGTSLDYLTGLRNDQLRLHPDALRIACEIDEVLKIARHQAPQDGQDGGER